MAYLNVGDKAPDFDLVSTDKKPVRLADFEDKKVLLLFFPFAFTGVCTKELCSVRDDIGRYSGLDAEVIAVSVDSPFTLAKFKEENNIPFLVLSDFNKRAIHSYGCVHETFSLGLEGVAKRSAFVVDRSGVIKYAEVLDNPGDLPNFEAVKSVLQSIK